jgi:cystathionine beta-synthase
MKEEIQAYGVLELIGNTPLIKLNKVTEKLEGNFYAKGGAFNPGHSSRIALHIIEEAERRDIISGDTIIETTSGNTGFSIAMVSIIKDIAVFLRWFKSSDKIASQFRR